MRKNLATNIFHLKLNWLNLLVIVIVLVSLFLFQSPRVKGQALDESSVTCTADMSQFKVGRQGGLIDINGVSRNYLLYVPASYDSTQAVPLVIAFHSMFQTTTQMAGYSGWIPVADEHNFLLLYPKGMGTASDFSSTTEMLAWNTNHRPDETFVDDVAFVNALLDELTKSFCIDPDRVYATGLNYGAAMSNRLACELSDRIAAFGPVSAASDYASEMILEDGCHPDYPVSIMAFQGTMGAGNDPSADIMAKQFAGDLSAGDEETWLMQWLKINACEQSPVQLDPIGKVSGIAFSRCAGNAEIVLYQVADMKIAWPGATVELWGEVANKDVNASEMLWEFFAAHPHGKRD